MRRNGSAVNGNAIKVTIAIMNIVLWLHKVSSSDQVHAKMNFVYSIYSL